jgi:NAD(P)H-hydrate repair Nnr-like enzyme with NAD(P)H-hydrate epimerase domain
MKIFTCSQIREIDEYTIRTEPVPSIDLMERAASQLLKWYTKTFDRSHKVMVFTGPGNNGGDGLALARLLFQARFMVEVFNVKFTDKALKDLQKDWYLK